MRIRYLRIANGSCRFRRQTIYRLAKGKKCIFVCSHLSGPSKVRAAGITQLVVQWDQRLMSHVFGLHLIRMVGHMTLPANGAIFFFVHNRLQALDLVRATAFLRFAGAAAGNAADAASSGLWLAKSWKFNEGSSNGPCAERLVMVLTISRTTPYRRDAPLTNARTRRSSD